MKEKTSITLSREVLARVDKLAGSTSSRSAFIEAVLRDYLKKRARAAIEARDLALINANADKLNAEAEDVLEYQDLDWSTGTVERRFVGVLARAHRDVRTGGTLARGIPAHILHVSTPGEPGRLELVRQRLHHGGIHAAGALQ